MGFYGLSKKGHVQHTLKTIGNLKSQNGWIWGTVACFLEKLA